MSEKRANERGPFVSVVVERWGVCDERGKGAGVMDGRTSGGVGRGDESGPAVWSLGGGGLVARRVRGDADGWLLGDVADVCERDARGWT